MPAAVVPEPYNCSQPWHWRGANPPKRDRALNGVFLEKFRDASLEEDMCAMTTFRCLPPLSAEAARVASGCRELLQRQLILKSPLDCASFSTKSRHELLPRGKLCTSVSGSLVHKCLAEPRPGHCEHRVGAGLVD